MPRAPRSAGSTGSRHDDRLVSPLDKAISLLQDLKMMSIDDDMADVVDQALECLGDAQIMHAPNVMKLTEMEDREDETKEKVISKIVVNPTQSGDDPETKAWLRANFLDTPRYYGRSKSLSFRNVARSIVASLWLYKVSSKEGASGDEAVLPGLDLTVAQRTKLKDTLASLQEWDFDVFQMHSLTGCPLQSTAYALYKTSTMASTLPVDEVRLWRFFKELEALYIDNPYHTSTHGADVMQTTMYFIGKGELAQHMTPLEILASYIAAAAHDVNHNGFNNNYHIYTMSSEARMHNNKAVLENHSTRIVFELLQREELNFAHKFDRPQFLQFRDHIIDLILATDMSQHFTVMGQVKSKIAANGDVPVKREDIPLYTKLAIKCADVSNPAKPRETYLRWADRVMEEFFRQGDMERSIGMPVSPFMDRQTTSIPKCQIGFIEFIVLPLYQACAFFLEEMSTPIANLESNLKYFKKVQEKEAAAGGAAIVSK